MREHLLSGGIEHERQRHFARPVLEHALIERLILSVREIDWERRLEFLHELLDIRLVLRVVQRDGKHLYAFAAILLVHLDDGRELAHTRGTPTRPEVDHDDLALAVIDERADLL